MIINLSAKKPDGSYVWPGFNEDERAAMGFLPIQQVSIVDQVYDASYNNYRSFMELCALSAAQAPVTAVPIPTTRNALVKPALSQTLTFSSTSLGARIGYGTPPVGSEFYTCAGFIVQETGQNFQTSGAHTLQVEYYDDFAAAPQSSRQQFSVEYEGDVQGTAQYAIFPMLKDTVYKQPDLSSSFKYSGGVAGNKNFLMPFRFNVDGGIYIQFSDIPDGVYITVQPIIINVTNLSSIADLLGN